MSDKEHGLTQKYRAEAAEQRVAELTEAIRAVVVFDDAPPEEFCCWVSLGDINRLRATLGGTQDE